MKLLVTGGLGFIGSNFIINTLSKYPEYEITNIDAELPGSNHKNLESIKKNSSYNFVKDIQLQNVGFNIFCYQMLHQISLKFHNLRFLQVQNLL